MDLQQLHTFKTVVDEGGFSAAGQKLLRSQPAVSLALKKLEEDLGDKLIDRSSKHLVLTDVGRAVYEYARRIEGLEAELRNTIAGLHDKRSGRLTIGANESTALYLLRYIEEYRKRYPGVNVEIRRSLSSRVPEALLSGSLDLGAISYDPGDPNLRSEVIYNDRLAFVVSPRHRLAGSKRASITDLGMESFIAHNVVSPYRKNVVDAFRKHDVPLRMTIEMPTVETIRKLVQANLGVAFLPKMCVEDEIRAGMLVEVAVEEVKLERKVRLVYSAKRRLSYAARAFLDVVHAAGEV